LISDFRQHEVTAFIHLPFVNLERGNFPWDKCGRQIKHAVVSQLAAGFNPEFIVAGLQILSFLPMTVNVHLITGGTQPGDTPTGGELLQRKQEQRLGRKPYKLRVMEMISSLSFASLLPWSPPMNISLCSASNRTMENASVNNTNPVSLFSRPITRSPSFSFRLQLKRSPKCPTPSSGNVAKSLPGVA